MKKLLVIGREGRLIKYAPEPDRLKEYDIVDAPVGARDEELLQQRKRTLTLFWWMLSGAYRET